MQASERRAAMVAEQRALEAEADERDELYGDRWLALEYRVQEMDAQRRLAWYAAQVTRLRFAWWYALCDASGRRADRLERRAAREHGVMAWQDALSDADPNGDYGR